MCECQNDADVDVIDCDGWSALHHACFGGHLGCVQFLLLNKTPLDIKDKVHLGFLFRSMRV